MGERRDRPLPPTPGSARPVAAVGRLLRYRRSRLSRQMEGGEGPFVEWFASGVLISDPTDPPYALWQLLRTLSAPSDGVLVLVSARAHGRPDLGGVLRSVTVSAAAASVHSAGSRHPSHIWLAVSGVGRDDGPHVGWLTSLAREYGIRMHAADGPIVAVTGGSLYTGLATGATGWRVIRADGVRPSITDRYPVPGWDLMVPYREVTIGSLIAQPSPAGVILRETWSAPITPDDDDFMIPVDPRHPTLVLAFRGVPRTAPDDVAALFARLPTDMSVRIMVSPTAGADPDLSWVRSLEDVLPHQKPSGPPVGGRVPTLLNHGWRRCGPRGYRLVDHSSVVAEVMPAGILLRPGQVYTSDAVAMFEPSSATLTVGTPGLEVSPFLVDALHRIFSARPPETGTIRLVLAGVADRALRSRIAGLAEHVDLLMDDPPAQLAPPALALPARRDGGPMPPPVPIHGLVRDSFGARDRVVAGPAAPVASVRLPEQSSTSSPFPLPQPPPQLPRPQLGTPGVGAPEVGSPPMFVAPIATISGPASDLSSMASVASVADMTRMVGPSGPARSGVAEAAAARSAGGSGAQTSGPAEGGLSSAGSGFVDAATGPVAIVAGAGGAGPPPITDRASTSDEQRRFSAALGATFTDSLATVNAALSTWPALRQDDSPGAKADYVAVCVYLGLTTGGAVALNTALRSGTVPDLDGYIPCLVSGLRRLPLHRRPVLCQGHLALPVERLYTVGAIVVEPGFRSASVAVDVAVSGTDVDVLIWSRTARQLSVLAAGRTFDEAVFPAGTRFKVLDVRGSWTRPAGGEDHDGARVPDAAVLLREVLADEEVSGPGLDLVDQSVLARLDKVLARRRRTPVHTIDDSDLIARLTGPLPGLATVPVTTQESS